MAQDGGAATGGEVSIEGSTILIVDDHPQNVELLEAYLEPLNCTIRIATDGLAALDAVAAGHPDLILLDVMMPKMSGFEVCKRLKSDPATKPIPIIMVTALNEVGDVDRGMESGTDDFISKPFNKHELLARVRNLLRLRRLQQQSEG